MRRRISLVAVAAVGALTLFGCGGGDYETSSDFPGMSVSLSGQYLVMSKDPGVLPNFYSLQLTHSGRSVQAMDNLGRTWTGTISNLTYYGVYPTGQEPTQQQQQQQPGQQQQQQPQAPESFHGEVYLSTETQAGTISITGVLDTSVSVTLTTGQGGQQQQQQATSTTTVISGTATDERGTSGFINLYNSVGQQTQGTTP